MNQRFFTAMLVVFVLAISLVSALEVEYTVSVDAHDANDTQIGDTKDFTKHCESLCSYAMPSFNIPSDADIDQYKISYAASTDFSVYFDSTKGKTTQKQDDSIIVEITPKKITCNKDQCDSECVTCSDRSCHEPGFMCTEQVEVEKIFPASINQGVSQVNVLLQNVGTVNLDDVTVELSGDGITTIEKLPVGRLLVDDQDYAFVKVNATKSGIIDVIIKVFVAGKLKLKATSQLTVLKATTEEQKVNVTQISDALAVLKQRYLELEQEYQNKKAEGFPLDIVYDKLRQTSGFITETQSSFFEGNYRKVQANLGILEGNLADIATQLKNARRQEETFKDKIKDNLLFFGSLAAAIVSIFTAYKLIEGSVNKKKILELHKKLSVLKKNKKGKKTVKKSKTEKKPEEPAP
jgi:hypothetical protein